jgi:hypothetical protein
MLAAGGGLMAMVGPVQLRHEVPTEVDLPRTFFNAIAISKFVAVVFEKGRWGQ